MPGLGGAKAHGIRFADAIMNRFQLVIGITLFPFLSLTEAERDPKAYFC